MNSNYLSFEQVVEMYPITAGALRKYLFHRQHNGLSEAVIKANRNLIFNRTRFEAWLEKFSEAQEQQTVGVTTNASK